MGGGGGGDGGDDGGGGRGVSSLMYRDWDVMRSVQSEYKVVLTWPNSSWHHMTIYTVSGTGLNPTPIDSEMTVSLSVWLISWSHSPVSCVLLVSFGLIGFTWCPPPPPTLSLLVPRVVSGWSLSTFVCFLLAEFCSVVSGRCFCPVFSVCSMCSLWPLTSVSLPSRVGLDISNNKKRTEPDPCVLSVSFGVPLSHTWFFWIWCCDYWHLCNSQGFWLVGCFCVVKYYISGKGWCLTENIFNFIFLYSMFFYINGNKPECK